MNSGAITLAVISLVAVGDIVIAFYFRRVADRAEMGENVSIANDPAATRRAATMMLIFAPIMWVAVALMSVGVIPVNGIDPIKF